MISLSMMMTDTAICTSLISRSSERRTTHALASNRTGTNFEFSSHPRHPPSTTRTIITPSAPLARWKTRGYVCVGGMDRRSFVNEWLDIDLDLDAGA